MNEADERVDGSVDEVDLTALRYALGELDVRERARFEERLMRDQVAREAVERAAWLIEAEAAPVVARARASSGRWSLVASLAAAGLLLATAIHLTSAGGDQDGSVDTVALMDTWIALGDPQSDLSDPDEEEPDDGDEHEPHQEDDEPSVPDWLIAALSER